MTRARRRLLPALALLLWGCAGAPSPPAAQVTPSPAPEPAGLSPSASPTPAGEFDVEEAMRHLRAIVALGPRPAGSESERRAAGYVESVLDGLGYEVRREPVTRPDGGTSYNLIARFPQADYGNGYLLVGAHYDTVAGSPGANDNASGVATLLAAAGALRTDPSLPVVFVGFAAEERQPPTGRDLVGSRAHAGAVRPAEVRAMVSVDMVGNGPALLVVRLPGTPDALQQRLGETASGLGIPVRYTDEYFSDHVPFARRGIPSALLFGGDHPTFHTPNDTLEVVRPINLEWAGRTLLQWARSAGRP